MKVNKADHLTREKGPGRLQGTGKHSSFMGGGRGYSAPAASDHSGMWAMWLGTWLFQEKLET